MWGSRLFVRRAHGRCLLLPGPSNSQDHDPAVEIRSVPHQKSKYTLSITGRPDKASGLSKDPSPPLPRDRNTEYHPLVIRLSFINSGQKTHSLQSFQLLRHRLSIASDQTVLREQTVKKNETQNTKTPYQHVQHTGITYITHGGQRDELVWKHLGHQITPSATSLHSYTQASGARPHS